MDVLIRLLVTLCFGYLGVYFVGGIIEMSLMIKHETEKPAKAIMALIEIFAITILITIVYSIIRLWLT